MSLTYGTTLYRTESLKKVIRWYTREFNKIIEQDDSVNGVVSTGSSGAIIAGLVVARAKREMVHIHVGKRAGHNGKLSGISSSDGNFVFVDDFIDSGASLRRCQTHLRPSKYIKYILCYGDFDTGASGRDYIAKLKRKGVVYKTKKSS